ncbi:hypothetical protein M378DRAFT_12907 [Amanita muscaria Koide BX008]|uniref:Uncharacterized protein n=1 Tax=Amanita muscaria (strain Koide BX008) TaxID=946122 RepID=A0A0C2SGS3_AMAMK|nr:hypothetical protein M378DRAFT_12907 [Amanita muscaria Koide BX008]
MADLYKGEFGSHVVCRRRRCNSLGVDCFVQGRSAIVNGIRLAFSLSMDDDPNLDKQIIPRSTFFSIGIKRRPPRSYPPDEVDENPKRLNGTQYFCLNHGIPDKTEACHVSIPNDASGFLFSVAATVDSAPKTGHFFGGDSVISD